MAILDLDIDLRLRSFTLSVALGVGAETLALVGPSGAGKSTVIRAVAGLVEPDRGRIALGGRTLFDSGERISVPPEERSVGLVFQDYALFPHMSVRRNVAFGERRGADRVDELLERFRISHLAEARPEALSGGERQRVALARALAREPQALLLDEPLSALDAHTRDAVRNELRELLDGLGLPVVFITHDYRDAAALADRAAVIVAGRLRQVGSVESLAESPTDAFVAALTGNNVLAGTASAAGVGSRVLLDGGQELRAGSGPVGRVGVVIAPWDVRPLGPAGEEGPETVSGPLGPAGEAPVNALRARVHSARRAGGRVEARVGPVAVECAAEEAERVGLAAGAQAWVQLPPEAISLVALEEGVVEDAPGG